MSNAGDQHQAASKLAQLLGEVIVHHAPWTAGLAEEAKARRTEEFLDGLEAHTAAQIGPFLQKLLDTGCVPDEFKHIIEEAIDPPAQFSAMVTQMFLYGIVSQLLGASIQPFVQGVSNTLWPMAVSQGINVPVSPAILATAAGRGLRLGDPPTTNVPPESVAEAARSGVSEANLNLQASLVGLPPALQELLELYRRGKISIDDVKRGLREGDFRDDWIDVTTELSHGWLTPLDFVRAAVQEQMSYGDARAWADKTGLDVSTDLPVNTGGTAASPDMFGLAYSISGRPPGPQELGRMANRGIIPWTGTGADKTSFAQGIAESDVKTKWTAALARMEQYVPPPRSVGTLYQHGAITKEAAIQFWRDAGVPDALANGYLYEAEQQHIGQDKLLALGDVKTGYYDGIFSHTEALGMLNLLGVRGNIAEEVLSVIDFRREIKAIDMVVNRVGALYTQHKLSATHAQAALEAEGLSPERAKAVMSRWEVLAASPIRVPSVFEISKAMKAGTITQDEAIREIEQLGYQPRDAVIVLSAHAGVKVPSLPPAGTTVTG